MVAAAARQPGGTLMLRSDRLTPAELAGEVLAGADLRQVHGDGKRMRQARSLEPKDTEGGSRIKRSLIHDAGPGGTRTPRDRREPKDGHFL